MKRRQSGSGDVGKGKKKAKETGGGTQTTLSRFFMVKPKSDSTPQKDVNKSSVKKEMSEKEPDVMEVEDASPAQTTKKVPLFLLRCTALSSLQL